MAQNVIFSKVSSLDEMFVALLGFKWNTEHIGLNV